MEIEHQVELGSRYHHLVHQYALGIPLNKLNLPAHNEVLAQWWENFQTAISESGSLHNAWTPSVQRLPETTISGHLGNVRLIAKMDINCHPSRWEYSDLRLENLAASTSPHLAGRTTSNQSLSVSNSPGGFDFHNGKTIKPEQLEMIYWYSSTPEAPIHFPYTQRQFQSDQAYLHSLLDTLLRLDANEFYMTDDERHCNYCVYRSLCNRGITAGQLTDYQQISINDDVGFGFDFSQIDEIVF